MSRWISLALLLALPAAAWANKTGIAGYSGMNQTTCTACHTAPGWVQGYIQGPSYLTPGQTGTYAFTLYSYGVLTAQGGLDLAATGGTLKVNAAEQSTTKLLSGELVHSTPKKAAAGFASIKWDFDWTAPSINGSYTFYAAGIVANGDGQNTGDPTATATFKVAVGTCQSNAQCNDNNPCTFDYCDPSTKKCMNNPIANCCNTSSDCDDSNPCTQNQCSNNHQCYYQPILGCCTTDAVCNDQNPCTQDYCDLSTNSCGHVKDISCCTFTIPCNDGNKCTQDNCNYQNNTCTYLVIPSCCKSNADCTDNSPCTQDTCDTATGLCLNTKISACCESPFECDDQDICTQDKCTANQCAFTAIPGCCKTDAECNDGNPCTQDACADTKCANKPIPGCVPPDTGPPPSDGPPAGDGPLATDGPLTVPDGPASGSDSVLMLPDGGVYPDASGTPPGGDDGCCRVSHRPSGTGLGLLLLVGLVLLGLRRRSGC